MLSLTLRTALALSLVLGSLGMAGLIQAPSLVAAAGAGR